MKAIACKTVLYNNFGLHTVNYWLWRWGGQIIPADTCIPINFR